jgi:proteasome assembly chaperone 4
MKTTISVETKYIASSDSSLPALGLQVTRLVDSYMIWIGSTEVAAEEVHNAPLHGCLSRDWACAMPPPVITVRLT